MKAGFIGTGSMGRILIDAFIQSGALQPLQIIAHNRSLSKVRTIAEGHTGLQIALSNSDVAKQSDIVFLCVKPSDYKTIIDEIKPVASHSQIIVSITSPVMIEQLEAQLPCKIAKVIPSITNFVFSGPTLCIYGKRMTPDDCFKLEQLLSFISTPLSISEKFTRISSDLTSCGPAFFALLLQKFVDAAVEKTGIPHEHANRLACEMLLGTGKLLTDGGMTTAQLQKSVAVPGGITAEGLRLIEFELNGMFNKLFQITHAKFTEDVRKVASSLLLTPD